MNETDILIQEETIEFEDDFNSIKVTGLVEFNSQFGLKINNKWYNPDNAIKGSLDLKAFKGRNVELSLNDGGYFTDIKFLDSSESVVVSPAKPVPTIVPASSKKILKQIPTNEYDVETLLKQDLPTFKKMGLLYVSWAVAWAELKRLYPTANYKVYENNDNMPYFCDSSGAFVKVGVIINNLEHISYLPVMDNKNKSIKKEDLTTFEINKSIQRALVKAVAMHGLGLFVYKGDECAEDTD